MKKEDFDGLIRSVTEAGQILRGEVKPSREFHVKVSEGSLNNRKGFALCIKSDEPELSFRLRFIAPFTLRGIWLG